MKIRLPSLGRENAKKGIWRQVLTLGLTVLILSALAVAFSAWRIWRLKRLKPPPPEDESIKAITDRMERDFEEIFRKWEQ